MFVPLKKINKKLKNYKAIINKYISIYLSQDFVVNAEILIPSSLTQEDIENPQVTVIIETALQEYCKFFFFFFHITKREECINKKFYFDSKCNC